MLVTGCAQLPVLLGSLLVAITGLPLGIAAGVTVTGPSGFNEILNATTLLSNVTAGSYSLSASTLNPADPIVTATFLVDAIDSDVEVSASATAVANVRYLRDRGQRRPVGCLFRRGLDRGQRLRLQPAGYWGGRSYHDFNHRYRSA